MKRIVVATLSILIVSTLAFLPTPTYAAEPSLASAMERFVKEPRCSGDRFMGVRLALIARPPFRSFRAMSSATAVDFCLERREFPGLFFPVGTVKRDASYFEFKASGQLSLSESNSEERSANFELTLGQPEKGKNRLGRPDLGTLVINFSTGRKQFSLPDSLTISAPRNGIIDFIYGEIDGGKAVISIQIEQCGLEGCG